MCTFTYSERNDRFYVKLNTALCDVGFGTVLLLKLCVGSGTVLKSLWLIWYVKLVIWCFIVKKGQFLLSDDLVESKWCSPFLWGIPPSPLPLHFSACQFFFAKKVKDGKRFLAVFLPLCDDSTSYSESAFRLKVILGNLSSMRSWVWKIKVLWV